MSLCCFTPVNEWGRWGPPSFRCQPYEHQDIGLMVSEKTYALPRGINILWVVFYFNYSLRSWYARLRISCTLAGVINSKTLAYQLHQILVALLTFIAKWSRCQNTEILQ